MKSSHLSPFMFILKGMVEAVSSWKSVILVHLTTCEQNSEQLEQRAVGTAVQHHFVCIIVADMFLAGSYVSS